MSEPSLSFTIPSVHDDKTLDCRLYSPSFSVLSPPTGNWQPRGAVFAHPYAPLGGCFDDPVILSTVDELLRHGFIVGTFNFRGAGLSKGATSWTGKAELSDYVSFTAFVIHYLNGLQCPSPRSYSLKKYEEVSSPNPSSLEDRPSRLHRTTTLVLGGYSYGSLITSRLPTTDVILERFSAVSKGTPEAEIILRAHSLVTQWNKDAQSHQEALRGRLDADKPRVASHAMAIAIGGEESKAGSRRPSRDSRRSFDLVRKSMDRSRRRLGARLHGTDEFDLRGDSNESLIIGESFPLRTCYLLISPLLPPISTLATMFSDLRGHNSQQNKPITNLTLVIYGSQDTFTSRDKLRKWAELQQGEAAPSCFQSREIATAGHFWREEGVEEELRNTIASWLNRTLEIDPTEPNIV